MGKDSFKKGEVAGAKVQQHIKKHPWETGAGLAPTIPKKANDPKFNAGVNKGRDDVRKPK